MNAEVQEQRELERLLSRLTDSSLDQLQANRLEELIRGKPERIQLYRDFVELDLMIDLEAALPSTEDLLSDSLSLSKPTNPSSSERGWQRPLSSRGEQRPHSWKSELGRSSIFPRVPLAFGRCVAVAAGLLLAVSLSWFFALVTRSSPSFLVTRIQEATLSGPLKEIATGDSLRTNEVITLDSGRLYFESFAGVRIAVEGPARLRPLATGNIELGLGKIRVRVPDGQEGFAVFAPEVTITDLGTEFGVEVTSTGRVNTEVYEGRVQVATPREPDLAPLELREGWYGVVHPGSKPTLHASPLGRETPAISWQDASQSCVSSTLAMGPEYYLRFDSFTGNTQPSLINRSLYKAIRSGSISSVASGPETTMGEQGQALKLDGEGGLEIPIGLAAVEQTGAYTFTLWARVNNSADQSILVSTNYLGPNTTFGPQLRLREDGTLEHYIYTRGYPRTTRGKDYLQRSTRKLPTNQWVHLALSAASNGQMQLFVNGEPAATPLRVPSSITGENLRVILGCQSGMRRDEQHHMEAFTGLIDELAFFNRQLSADEISSLYEAAKQSFEEDTQ